MARRVVALASLALIALLVAVPQAPARVRPTGVCASGATPRPCYTVFEVNGGAPPSGLSLDLQSSGGNVTAQLSDTSGGSTIDVSGLLSGSDTVHMVMDLGTYVPHFVDTTGEAVSYSIDTTDASHTMVTLDAQPRPSSWNFSCSVSSCPTTANVDFGEMLLAAFTDLSGAPDPSLVSEIDGSWVSTNAQALQLPPTFDAGTGAFSFHVASPHFETDGTTVNEGFFRAFLPDAVVESMGIADPSSVTDSSFKVASSGGGTVSVTVCHTSDAACVIDSGPSGVVIDAPLGSFHYSSPTFTITKATGGGATLDHFAVTAVGGGAISTQTAGHAFGVKVTAKTSSGSTLTGFSGSVDLGSNAVCAAGCSSAVGGFSNGSATASITLTRARTGATITATQHGGSKTGTSAAFTVGPAAAGKLVFVQTSTASLTSGTSRALKAAVEDAYGNKVTAGSHTVTFAKASGAGTVAGLGAVTSSSGVASVSVTGVKAGSITIHATSTGLTAGSLTFAVVHGAAAKLAFTSGTGSLSLGQARTLKVQVRDAAGNAVPSPSVAVAFAKASGTGTVSGLGGATSSGGVASRSVTATGAGSITIKATSSGLTQAATTFTITS